MTQAIADIATPLGIAVHDHIIVGKDGACEPETDEVDLMALRSIAADAERGARLSDAASSAATSASVVPRSAPQSRPRDGRAAAGT